MILVAIPRVDPAADASTLDVLAQAAMAEEALSSLGLEHRRVEITDGRVWEELPGGGEETVFNLLEAPPGRPLDHASATAALELLGYAVTGSPSPAMWLTTDKIATRVVLRDEGVPVAPGGRFDPERPGLLERVAPPWILKPAWEDASLGLEGDPLCHRPEEAIHKGRRLRERFPGQPLLLESFLPGREFNLSILETLEGLRVLPPAEMEFVDFPPGLARLVGYEAKWDEESFVYRHTVRHFPSREQEGPLLDRLAGLTLAAWRATGVRGYARVDFRLDEAGTPCVLEINANPCLAPDAGFLAAAREAGLAPRDVVRHVVEAAAPTRSRRSAVATT